MTTATKKVSKKKISPDVLAQVLREVGSHLGFGRTDTLLLLIMNRLDRSADKEGTTSKEDWELGL